MIPRYTSHLQSRICPQGDKWCQGIHASYLQPPNLQANNCRDMGTTLNRATHFLLLFSCLCWKNISHMSRVFHWLHCISALCMQSCVCVCVCVCVIIIIIIMYIYHALINALSAHMIHINLNMIFYTHVKHSPTKTIYRKYYLKNNNNNNVCVCVCF